MEVVRLAARTDFRLEKLAGQPVWHVPADRAADAALDEAWRRLTGGHAGRGMELIVKGAPAAGAARGDGRRALFIPRSVRAAARRCRLSQDRARIPYHRARPHPGDGLRPPQRGQALHHPDRHALRQRREARRLGRGRARRALSRERRLRGAGVQAHRLAPDRDALAKAYLALPHGRRDSTASGVEEGIVET